ncbi:MAG: glycoside hydrolase family 127 protein [Clostridia bacterium]|nr:glycoside hydrolase family 127 protein [Clostridia bacterium]
MSNQKTMRPQVREVSLQDAFWKPYLAKIRSVTMPYVFDKLEEKRYFSGFVKVRDGIFGDFDRVPFCDGLVFESMRGACDFLAQEYDADLDKRLDGYVELVQAAQDAVGDGYICTKVTCLTPDWRWGRNGGDIVIQHDLYNQGALVEAAISHYLATKKTTLLACAVRSANLICREMGEPPKLNVIPGHSLPEEAFVKLYRLFRDHRELDTFARENGVNCEDYLEMARFWYDNRGNYTDRDLCRDPRFPPRYNQDHLPFAKQRTAEGHAVRAALCYTGAAMVAYEADRSDYKEALDEIWENIVNRKLHITGGIGTRHDIEGFDVDFNLPHDAYLETCAAIGLAFFNGEMALLSPHGKYFDVFERSLYNNVLAAVGEDGTHFFYQNPLISDGNVERWDWHGCPCCPPMLLKLFSSLATYVYAYSPDTLYLNLHLDSKLDTETVAATLNEGKLRVDSKGKEMTLCLRVPAYAKKFALSVNGVPQALKIENGYAVLRGIWTTDTEISIDFEALPQLIVSDPRVEANRDLVAVTCGPKLYCAEAIDNNGSVGFTVAQNPSLSISGGNVVGKTADGSEFTLIPYYRWCNRHGGAMQVWFPYAASLPTPTEGILYQEIKK